MTAYFATSGAGNDFLALPEPERTPGRDEIRAWCRRGLSLGADGLFVLRRSAAPVATARPAVTMDYFNADGGAADLCLNGARCAARLAFHLGWAGDEVEVITGAGPVVARRLGDARVALELPRPGTPVEARVEVAERAFRGFRVDAGVPHFVLVWSGGLGSAPVAELGPALRRHPAFGAAGANVDFARFPAADRCELRTFERGVEAETLACGTGVLAVAAVGLALGRLALPATALTAGGFPITVGPAADPGERWTMAGDARILARGELLPEATALPEPPAWAK
jgi:diaminopimelate epimerase